MSWYGCALFAIAALYFLYKFLKALWVEDRKEVPPDIRPDVQMLINLVAQNKDWVKSQSGMSWFHPSGVTLLMQEARIVNHPVGFEAKVRWGSINIYDRPRFDNNLDMKLNLTELAELKIALKEAGTKIHQSKVLEVAKRIEELYGDKS